MQLSIIIPVYNVEKYIGKTLESLCAQRDNLSLTEIIIVNDGTPDKSMDIVKGYVGKIPNMLIVNQENGGLSNARNTGLKKSRGKYVWFVDSDDWIEQDSIKHIKKKLLSETENIDVLCYKIREYNETGEVICEKHFPFNREQILNGVVFLQSSISFAPMQQFIIRKDFLTCNGLKFVDGLIHEDVEFAPRMLLKADKVCIVPEVAYCYLRRSGDNITGSKKSINEKRLKSLQFILDEYLELEMTTKSRVQLKIIKRVQRIAIYAMYNFASLEQIKENYLGAFRGDKAHYYKRIICRSLVYYNEKYTHLLWDVLFLISPRLYKRVSSL